MNKEIAVITSAGIIIGLIALIGYLIFTDERESEEENGSETGTPEEVEEGNGDVSDDDEQEASREPREPEVVASGLTIPWDVRFLPEGGMLITQRPGIFLLSENGGSVELDVDVEHIGEGGLLGLELHPRFSENRSVYLYRTIEEGGSVSNRVDRYFFDDEESELVFEEEIVTDIPGARFHNGGRIAFGPDGYLYITTGDAEVPALSQERGSLAGKVLRVEDDGSLPDGNPFGTALYSYGHRNPQGLAWDSDGQLWSTEHGPVGFDELNRIEAGNNYGWPVMKGDQETGDMPPPEGEEFTDPVIHSGPNTADTWAPSGAAYYDGSIFFAGLRGATLYEARIAGNNVELHEHMAGEFGRLRTVVVGPDEALYITTSNRDGRGNPSDDDDRIIRIDPDWLRDQ